MFLESVSLIRETDSVTFCCFNNTSISRSEYSIGSWFTLLDVSLYFAIIVNSGYIVMRSN